MCKQIIIFHVCRCFGHFISYICHIHLSNKCGTCCVQLCEHGSVTSLIIWNLSPFNVSNNGIGITCILWDLGLVSMVLVFVPIFFSCDADNYQFGLHLHSTFIFCTNLFHMVKKSNNLQGQLEMTNFNTDVWRSGPKRN